MNPTTPNFFKKSGPKWAAIITAICLLTGCNPFDDRSTCPKLLGVAEIGGYRIEKVPIGMSGLFGFQFVDSLTGYAQQNSRAVFRTDDGGKNWRQTAFGNENFGFFSFPSRDTGFIVESFFGQPDFQQKLVVSKTVDGGQTKQMVGDTINGSVSSIVFLDSKNGWMAAQFNTFDPGTGQATFDYGLFSTKDGGATWTKDEQFQPVSVQKPMVWVDKKTGFLITANATLAKTTDGGDHWEEKPWQPFLSSFPQIFFLDENFGYTGTINQFGGLGANNCYFTQDGGQTWAQMSVPDELVAVLDFDKNKRGLFVARSTKCSAANATGFFATGDDGQIGDETNPLEDVFQWEAVHFGDPAHFFVVVNGGQLLKVTRN